MPSNHPFLSSFLSAFRAHSVLQQQGKHTSQVTSSQATHSNTASASVTHSTPRTITTTTTTTSKGATTAALSSLHSPRAHSTSPLSTSPGDPSSPPTATTQRRYIQERGRRGSDSSTEGFRDVLGKEKWYIGGRTAAGEERYFKLGTVRRQRSWAERSLDRLSL
ncbi:hypothetical protein OIDMADRAFT_140636 [Oidiodendron maius Zn]|uniref:Uncharacterized protein n=1 Tax=Oidiodendron maius (strain Zn) TaxID=913774 RepID=A0A0C3HZC5_OIDMZ|nr:hypothetical protein OIDMADRAFT_140636 [Oidiodendron maius Zn]